MKQRSRIPLELWIFIGGCFVWFFVPFLPWPSVAPSANPVALFPVATALAVIETRETKLLWGTAILVVLSSGSAFLHRALFPGLSGPIDIWWAVAAPAVLLGLLFSPRVRRFVAEPDPADEPTPTRCNWCNRSGGDLQEVVVDSTVRGGTRRPMEYWVHPEHQREFLRWQERAERHRKHLRTGGLALVGGAALATIVVLAAPQLAVGVCAALGIGLGVAFLTLPSGEPAAIRRVGLRRSIAIGRWSGVVMIAAGLWLLIVILPRL